MKRERAVILVLAIFSIAIRFIYMSPYPAGWDDIDFALALDRFDLSSMQPHFPGYPVYILLAHLFYSVIGEPFAALSTLSAVAGGFTVIPLWMLFRELGSRAAAGFAVMLYALAPLPFITGIQPTSDALGSMMAALLALLIWRSMKSEKAPLLTDQRTRMRSFIMAGVTLGLLLGIRVSYAPLVFLWAGAAAAILIDRTIPRGQAYVSVFLSAAAAVSVCGVWFGALAVSEGGIAPLMKLAFSFTEGHFTDWGGAYTADSSFLERARYFLLRQIGAAGLGTVWPGASDWRWLPTVFAPIGAVGFISAILMRVIRKARITLTRKAVFLLLWMIPYLLWAFFAQNIEKPRHILPLIPPVLWLLVTGLERLCSNFSDLQRRKVLFVSLGLLWLAGTAAVTYPLAREANHVEPPVLQLAKYVKEQVPTDDSIMFTWEEQRVISYVSPEHHVIRLRHWGDMRKELLQYPQPPRHIFATNAFIQGMDRTIGSWFNEIVAFEGSPWLYPTYHRVVLYEQKPGFIDGLR